MAHRYDNRSLVGVSSRPCKHNESNVSDCSSCCSSQCVCASTCDDDCVCTPPSGCGGDRDIGLRSLQSDMPSSYQLLSDHSPSRRMRRSSLAGLYCDSVGGVADASSSRHECIGYYEIVLIGCCVCSPSSFILESPPVDVKRSCCACACCFAPTRWQSERCFDPGTIDT